MNRYRDRLRECMMIVVVVVVLRRMLMILSIMFWQGGFMFYGGVVVPVGGSVLESDTQQGFITQSVTNYLNLAGAACLLIWVSNLWYDRKSGVLKIEWMLWCFTAVSLAVLVVVHSRMDQILNQDSTTILNPKAFDLYHKIYIGTSSLQWAAMLCLLLFAMIRWKQQDHGSNPISAPIQ